MSETDGMTTMVLLLGLLVVVAELIKGLLDRVRMPAMAGHILASCVVPALLRRYPQTVGVAR